MAERLHEIIKASAPALSPKTWYGMPAYAKDGKVVCALHVADGHDLIRVQGVRCRSLFTLVPRMGPTASLTAL